MVLSRRDLLHGFLGLGLTSCLGPFKVLHLNNAAPYELSDPLENISRITFAHLNAADLRGNTPNLFKFISKEKAYHHAKWLADFLLAEGVDVITLNEVDYAGTAKTGGLDQPKIIAEYMGSPYDYVVFDQYMKSPLWTTGNAVISRFPMQKHYRRLFGDDGCGFENRLEHLFKDFIHVKLKIGRKEVDLITTHLDNGEDYNAFRTQEAQELADYLAEFTLQDPDSYTIVSGDYNDGSDSETMKMIMKKGVVLPPAENFGLKTYQNGNPTHDLDHILASSNIKIHDYRTFVFPWSDHLGLICELEFIENYR